MTEQKLLQLKNDILKHQEEPLDDWDRGWNGGLHYAAEIVEQYLKEEQKWSSLFQED